VTQPVNVLPVVGLAPKAITGSKFAGLVDEFGMSAIAV